MKTITRRILLVSSLVLAVCAAVAWGVYGCFVAPRQHSAWLSSEMWYQSDVAYDSARIDVFYLVSTEVLSATDSTGDVVWQSQLIPSDKAAMTGEIAWVERNMFYDDFNVFAPYYHQFTFDAICHLSPSQFDSVYQQVVREACEAFDVYMAQHNHGRPFVLAGFSQGAMLTLDVLRHMTAEQYSQMIACYTIGYRLADEDLCYSNIRPASGETDNGVVICFNSTLSQEAIWPFVSKGAKVCINPINWQTDATPAVFSFDSTTNEVHVDSASQVLMVSTDNPAYYRAFYDQAPFFLQVGVSRDNLHHWDLLFYASCIHDNALLRYRTAVCLGKKEHSYITPLPAGVAVEDLEDCTVPAMFTIEDFRWMGGNLRMTVFNMDLYDAVDISRMQVGDTLLYNGEPIVISRLTESDGGLDINGGLDEGGCCLAGYEGGTYIAHSWDDHATYTELGKTEMALAEDFVIIDCGLNPTDPIDTIRTGQKRYIESLEDSRRDFYPLSTRVTIEHGMITEINRHWIP